MEHGQNKCSRLTIGYAGEPRHQWPLGCFPITDNGCNRNIGIHGNLPTKNAGCKLKIIGKNVEKIYTMHLSLKTDNVRGLRSVQRGYANNIA